MKSINTLVLVSSLLLAGVSSAAQPKRALARTARPGHFTTAAVKESGEHGGALSPTTEDPARFSAVGNEAFGACMTLWNAHRWDEARAAMLAFSAAHPADPWRGESDLHVACYHKFRGEHTEAEAILARLAEEQRGNPVGRKALVRLSRVYFDTRRPAASRAALHELLSRDPTENEKTYALNWLLHINRAELFARAARECGPKAFGLAAYLLTAGRAEKTASSASPQFKNIPSLPAVSFAQVAEAFPWAAAKGGPDGVSVAEMRARLSAGGWGIATRRLTYPEAAALAAPSSPVILCVPAPSAPLFTARLPATDAQCPPLGHYTVLVRADDATAWLVDPDNGLVQKDARALRDDWLRGAAHGLACLLTRADFPAPPPPLRASAPATAAADEAFTGGCCGHETNNNDTGIADDDTDPCEKYRRSRGMPVHAVHTLNLNYLLVDTPLWLDAPAGPSLELVLTYNDRDADNARYASPDVDVQLYPFGYRWSVSYESTTVALDPGNHLLFHLPSGRELYFNRQSDGTYLPRDPTLTGSHTAALFPDGSARLSTGHGTAVYTYHPANSPFSQTLASVEDAFGNALIVTRDETTGRFVSVSSTVTRCSLRYDYNQDGTVSRVYAVGPDGGELGRSAAFTYLTTNGTPLLASITDMGGQTTTLEYGSRTRQLKNNSGTTVSHHHAAAMTWPNGGRWEFDLHQTFEEWPTYDEPSELSITDPEGHVTTYNYHAYAALGPTVKRDRNGASKLWALIDETGSAALHAKAAALANDRWDRIYTRRGDYLNYRTFSATGRRDVTFERELFSPASGKIGFYDSLSSSAAVTDNAARRDTAFTYNNNLPSGGRLITASNKVYRANSSTPAEAWTESAELDANDDPVRLTARDGSSLLFSRTNRLVTAVQLLTVNSPLSTVSTQTLWQAAYNALGQTLWHTADEGLDNTVRYTYDAAHRPVSISAFNGGAHAATLAEFDYEDGGFLPSTIIDADGNPVSIERDTLERPVLITYPDGTADSYVYDCCAPSLHVDRHGVTNRFTYDGNKRLESALAPFDARTSTALAFSYLGEGELAALGVAAAAGPDLPAARSFATRTFAYAVTNGLTRLAARKDAIGRTRESFTHTFDGLPASRADACGNLATNVWDASHTRLLQRSTFDVQRSAFSSTTNRHDLARDLLTNTVRHVTSSLHPVIHSSLLTINYSYDSRRRPVSQTVTLSGLPGQTAPLVYSLGWAYGPRGFVTNRTLTVGAAVIPEAYTHHPFLPALASVANPHASAAYTHSDSGRLLAKATPAVTEHRAYDALQRPASTAVSNTVLHSSLLTINYEWDVDRLASVSTLSAGGQRQTVFAYNLQSMVTGATTYTNAAPAYLERFDYKATGSMVARSFTPYTDALAAPNASFAVNRADETTRHIRNGAVTITGTADPAATVKYYPTAAKPPVDAERDASGRWIAPNVPMHPMSNGLVHIQFRVDQDGQAPSFRLSEFSVNKVTTVIGNDANGSITNLPGGMGVPPLILAYDCEGNLACVSNTVSGAVSLFWYDQYSCRIAKQENGLLTLYIWDGMDIIATAHADGTIREYYTRGIGIAGDVGSLIAETRFENNAAVSTTYLHSNWRGDVVMATDASGAVVGEYAYTTFGEQLSATGTYTPRFTFSSKERDASGLVYHGFRYYSPVLCRWISEDPIREFGGINLYQFCGNNPVNSIDVDGWVDMNLFPPNEPIRRYADKAKTTDGAFSVGMHGSPTALFDATKKELAISDLAQQILRSPIYKPGQTVSLASCNAGRGGSNSNAQKLANELTKKTGIETTVKGPDSLLEYYSDGKVKPRGNGTWKIFTGKTGETK
jgi:RHS repeat-associated protein